MDTKYPKMGESDRSQSKALWSPSGFNKEAREE